jgi:hypothetical protein
MNKKILLGLLFIIFTGASCKKNSPGPKGNSFSCVVNGTTFTPCDDPGGFGSGPSLFGGYYSNYKIVTITAQCNQHYPNKYVTIELDNFQGIGDYLLSDINNTCMYIEYTPDKRFSSNLTGNGKVTITKDDRTNYIVEGTFQFTAANTSNPSDIVTVNSGQFYIKF